MVTLKKGTYKFIWLQMNSQMNSANLPKKISIYFTSESNSYGAIGKEWLDSKPFKQLTPLGFQTMVHLTPEKVHYLENYSECSQKSFFEQWKHWMINSNFTECPRKCSPALLPFDDLPICGWNETDFLARVKHLHNFG